MFPWSCCYNHLMAEEKSKDEEHKQEERQLEEQQRDKAEQAKRKHEDDLLEQAIEDSFPASDPPSVGR